MCFATFIMGHIFMDTKKLLGKRIKELIKRNGISQEKIAEMAGIEPAALSNIVTGRNYPLLGTLDKIIKILNVNYVDVFDFEHKESSETLKKQIIEMLDSCPGKIEDIYKITKALLK